MNSPPLTADDLSEVSAGLFVLDWILTQMLRGDLIEAQYADYDGRDVVERIWSPEVVQSVRAKARALRKKLGTDEPNVDEVLGEIDSAVREAIFKVIRSRK